MLHELQQAAHSLDLYVGTHRECRDPARCFYVAHLGQRGAGILKFATADEVRRLLSDRAQAIRYPEPQVTNEDADEHFTLRNMARPLGLHVGVHTHLDPTKGSGRYYVMARKVFSGLERNPSLLRYATAETVEKFLEDFVSVKCDD